MVEAFDAKLFVRSSFLREVCLTAAIVRHIFHEALKVQGLENAVLSCFCLKHCLQSRGLIYSHGKL